jgi:predicted ATPase
VGPWPTSLVGRERERREVGALLETRPLVTITGAGGSGKTRLACAVAEDRADHHADGIVWVELARTAEPAQVAPMVVAACGLLETPGASPLELLPSRLAKSDSKLARLGYARPPLGS